MRIVREEVTLSIDVRLTQWLAVISAVVSFTVVGFYLRMYPVFLYGWYINEFDPYIRYFMTLQVLEQGVVKGLLWWLHRGYGEIFTNFWYPWGINWTIVLSPGVSWFAAVLYKVLERFGFTLLQSSILLSALVNTAVIPSMYYLGHRIGGRYVGLLSALWAVYSGMIIQRGTASWLADAPIFQFLATLGLALYIDALLRRGKVWIILGLLSALINGISVWVWGSYVFLWNFYGVFTIIILIYALMKLYRGSKPPFDVVRAILTYVITDLGFSVFVAVTPRYSIHTLFSGLGIVADGALLFSLVVLALVKLSGGSPRRLVTYSRYALIALLVVATIVALFLSTVGGKYLGALLPIARSAIVQSVAEHAPSSLQQGVLSVSFTLPFVAFSLLYSIFTVYVPGLLVGIASLIAAYFGSSEVWLYMIVGVVWIPAAAYGLVRLLGIILERRTVISYVLGIAVVALFAYSLANNVNASVGFATLPQQIVSTVSPPVPSPDWLDALRWIAYNTPRDARIMSWWDYGYWIAVIGNRTSLADNSTVNSTQIATIGELFVSNPHDYAKILGILNSLGDPQYILIFEPYTPIPTNITIAGSPICVVIPEYPAGGDFAKSYWMARIAGYPQSYISTYLIGNGQISGTSIYAPQVIRASNGTVIYAAAYNVTIYSLMFNHQVLDSSYVVWSQCTSRGYRPYWAFEEVPTLTQGPSGFVITTAPIPSYSGPSTPYYYLYLVPQWAQLVYVSRPNGWVLVYRVDYDILRRLAGSS